MDASRFDAFAKTLAVSAPRRRAFRLLVALGLGGVLVRSAVRSGFARTGSCPAWNCKAGECWICWQNEAGGCACYCDTCGAKGIGGGGMVRREGGGEAHLALLATRTEDPDNPGTFAAQGQVRWFDPTWEGAGLDLESLGVAYYGPTAVEGEREAVGWLRADKAPGDHPFVIRAVDVGVPGSGEDRVSLLVGDAALEDPVVLQHLGSELTSTTFRYAAEGTLVSGDFQLLSLAAPALPSASATPTP